VHGGDGGQDRGALDAGARHGHVGVLGAREPASPRAGTCVPNGFGQGICTSKVAEIDILQLFQSTQRLGVGGVGGESSKFEILKAS